MARRRRPRPRGWYEKDGDPAGTERFWDGENWGPNPRRKKGAPEPAPQPAAAEEPAPNVPFEPATIWARITARSTDILLLLLPWWFIWTRAFSRETGAAGADTAIVTDPLFIWLAGLLVFTYEVAFVGTRGATPGKRLIGLLIVDRETGDSPPRWSRTLFRSTPLLLVGFVIVVPFLWLGCVASIALDRRLRRSVFDFTGSTVVVFDPRHAGKRSRRRG